MSGEYASAAFGLLAFIGVGICAMLLGAMLLSLLVEAHPSKPKRGPLRPLVAIALALLGSAFLLGGIVMALAPAAVFAIAELS